MYVIKTLIILNSLINKKWKKLNIWQTHFRSVFKMSYFKSSIGKRLLNLPLKPRYISATCCLTHIGVILCSS